MHHRFYQRLARSEIRPASGTQPPRLHNRYPKIARKCLIALPDSVAVVRAILTSARIYPSLDVGSTMTPNSHVIGRCRNEPETATAPPDAARHGRLGRQTLGR